MKVVAKHNIKLGDKRIAGGEVFEVSEKDLDAIREYVEPVGYVSTVFPPEPETPKPTAAAKKRPGSRKAGSAK